MLRPRSLVLLFALLFGTSCTEAEAPGSRGLRPVAEDDFHSTIERIVNDARVEGYSAHEGCGEESCFVDVEFRIRVRSEGDKSAIFAVFER